MATWYSSEMDRMEGSRAPGGSWDQTAGPISADSPALLDEAIAEHDKKENP